MKRILLLTTLAAMMAAAMALFGVAQAKPISDSPDAKCEKLAIQTLGASFNPANYTFHGSTAGNDIFTGDAGTLEVFCGFGGDDGAFEVQEGDIFLGGAGVDSVNLNNGTFYGGAGNDLVNTNIGTFYGGAGNDLVFTNKGTFNGGEGNDFVRINNGIFNGGEGNDSVHLFNQGTFNGGAGNDSVNTNIGTFNGEAGDDSVITNDVGGTFNGGAGDDSVNTNRGTVDLGDEPL